MSDQQVHFEVHVRQSGSWTVQKVGEDKTSSVETAKQLKTNRNVDAVKVLQVSFDSSDPVFHDKEIYFDGDREQAGKKNDVDLIEPVCKKLDDIYRPEARRAIWSLLQKPMQGWQITPLELLHHQGHLQRLNDTGQILQGAVQRVAISQVQKTGQKVNDRVLDLYSFANEALGELKKLTIEDNIPDIEDGNLIRLSKKLKEDPNWRRTFMMALARFFHSYKTVDDKFKKVLEWLGLYDDPRVLEILDRYLADFLSQSQYLQTILGEEENLGDAMLGLVDFIRGSRKFTPDMHKGAIRINALLRDQFLPETRAALSHRFLETLCGNKSFVANNPFKSIQYHSRLLARMHIADGEHVGGEEAVEALKDRCERMTGPTTIATILGNENYTLDRAEKLLKVSEGVIGGVNKRTIANYLLPVLDSSHNIKLIMEAPVSPLATVARLRNLQIQAIKSGFQIYYEEKITTALDDLAVDLINNKEILQSFSRNAKDNTQLGLNLLQLIASDKLTQPACEKLVRQYARKTIASNQFMEALEEKAKQGAAQVEFFKSFYAALEKTGIR